MTSDEGSRSALLLAALAIAAMVSCTPASMRSDAGRPGGGEGDGGPPLGGSTGAIEHPRFGDLACGNVEAGIVHMRTPDLDLGLVQKTGGSCPQGTEPDPENSGSDLATEYCRPSCSPGCTAPDYCTQTGTDTQCQCHPLYEGPAGACLLTWTIEDPQLDDPASWCTYEDNLSTSARGADITEGELRLFATRPCTLVGAETPIAVPAPRDVPNAAVALRVRGTMPESENCCDFGNFGIYLTIGNTRHPLPVDEFSLETYDDHIVCIGRRESEYAYPTILGFFIEWHGSCGSAIGNALVGVDSIHIVSDPACP